MFDSICKQKTKEQYNKYGVILFILAVITLLGSCTAKDAQDVSVETSKITVVVQPITKQVVQNTHTLFSTIKGVEEVSILPNLGGEIESVLVQNGSLVIIGDPLYRLKSTAVDKQIDQAKKSVELAKENYDSAKERYQEAQINLDKNAQLLAQGSISQSTYDQVKQSASSAQQDAAKIQYEQALLQLKQIQQGLADLTYTSKANGTISQFNVKAGDVIQPGLNLGKIIDTSAYKVDLAVAERLYNQIDLSTPIGVYVPSLEKEFTGKIIEIGQSPNSGGKLFPIKISFDNANQILASGLFCEVNFELGSSVAQLAVPSTAVLRDELENYVYTLDPTTESARPQKTAVELGFDNGTLVEIKSGLDQKLLLVVKGQQYITEDNEIAIIKED